MTGPAITNTNTEVTSDSSTGSDASESDVGDGSVAQGGEDPDVATDGDPEADGTGAATDESSVGLDSTASVVDDGSVTQGADPGAATESIPDATDANTGVAAEDGASASGDLGPPYLIVDQYSGDSGMNPPWAAVVDRSEFYGAIIKAWEGRQFDDGGWFARNWSAVKDAGGTRYGTSWFRGAYLFLKFDTSGADQAAAYLKAVDDAGGWGAGDVLPIIDVELGGATNTNHQASKQQVIDCVSDCAAALKSELNRRVMLYGRGAMRDLGIVDKMGCDVAWNPSYTQQMTRHGLEAFDLEEIVLWQYCGDNTSYLPDYPHQVDGFTKVDISAFVKGAQRPTLDDVRQALLV